MPTVLVTEPIAQTGLDLLAAECEVLAPWKNATTQQPPFREQLAAADAVIVRLQTVTAEDLQSAPQLRVIGKHGVGVDNIDVAAATDRALPVVFTPAANANAVAEHAIALMFALARHIVPTSQALHAGRFSARNEFPGVEVAGKTLGVVGLGRVGNLVAAKANGLGMQVLGFDPFVTANKYEGSATLADNLEQLLAASDFLSLHVPLTDRTRRFIDAELLSKLKPECRLINTSRGAVVDEAALVAALHQDQLAGAALDVFEQEPLPADHPLCGAPRTLLTPHIASSTRESLECMSRDVAQGVLDVLAGRRPEFQFNSLPS